MKKQDFKLLWESRFSGSYPIGHELKLIYKNKWLRIHSLPKSKRYAETEEEYQIIYERQNKIVKDLIGENEKVVLSFGLYTNDLTNQNYRQIDEFNEFEKVDILDLYKIRPDEFENKFQYTIYAKETIWIPHRRNKILKLIADDKIRMMIISFNKSRIIIPYDGGVDLILESEEIRDEYKIKYKNWLSKHPKGL